MEKVESVTGLRPLEAPQDETAAGAMDATCGGVGLGWHSHERKGDMGFVWHRRSTDPK
jgi:hypothetical protein